MASEFDDLPHLHVVNSLYRNNIVLVHDADGTICPPEKAAFPLKIFFSEIPNPDEGDYYASSDLMERYKLGPAEFVEYLMTHKDLFPHGVPDWFYIQHRVMDETGIGFEYQPMSRKVEELDKLTFHYRTIRNHEKAMQDGGYYDKHYSEWQDKISQNEASADNSSRIAELEAQLVEAQAIIAQSRAGESNRFDFNDEREQDSPEYIAALASIGDVETAQELIREKDIRIAELKEQLAAATLPLTPQQKAALVKGGNTLNAWKPRIAAMIKVAVRCGAEGPKLRQRPDFNTMFNELDAELNGEQEKFFRESMPDEHIDRLGDARRKAAPLDNV